MSEFKIPKNVSLIISRLNDNGYRADIVGGCVRDIILSKEPDDFDITTSAKPEETERIFSDFKLLKNGIKHGTVTVIIDKEPYEITTYRFDGEYTDNRHPDRVTFTSNIDDDLSRRDFTVNAIAYNPKDKITDLYGGREDIQKRIIRAVGDPVSRFSEDALRIFRAIRFASVLDFKIDAGTGKALFEKKESLLGVSAERLYTEWKKLISGKGAYRILREYSEIVAVVIPELVNLVLPDEGSFDKASGELRELSLFALSTDLPKDAFVTFSERLKTDSLHKKRGGIILDNLSFPLSTYREIYSRLIAVGEYDILFDIIKLKILLGKEREESISILSKMQREGVAYRIKDLKINGDDLKMLGKRGVEIGLILNSLLNSVADGEIKNERDELLGKVKSL
jgi:tRNA nucleotidyltransferase (CCA-adding enzyme)